MRLNPVFFVGCSRSGIKRVVCHEKVFYRSVTMKACSSREATKKLGVSLMTLRRCIADRKLDKASEAADSRRDESPALE